MSKKNRSNGESASTATENGAPVDASFAPKESKQDKFVRLANRRMVKLIKLSNQVLNLSNRAQYDYSPEQAEKIISRLDGIAKTAKLKFGEQSADEEKPTFF